MNDCRLRAMRVLISRTQQPGSQAGRADGGSSAVQILRQLQELAAAQELRFEVSREPALCFEVRSDTSDVLQDVGKTAMG